MPHGCKAEREGLELVALRGGQPPKRPLSASLPALPGLPGSVNGTLSPSPPRLFPLPGEKATLHPGPGWEEPDAPQVPSLSLDLESSVA